MLRNVSNNGMQHLSVASTSPESVRPVSEISNGHRFDRWLQQFDQLRLGFSEDERVFWCSFAPSERACFNLGLLQDLRQMQRDIAGTSHELNAPRAGIDFDFMVVGSATPDVYNLGGDLALFRKLVKDKDKSALRSYAQLCVDVVCANENSYGAPINTIAMVEGSCLGGGFEAALSCDTIIAEDHVKFGFPEIIFGLFPGMGAINFLTRRVARNSVVELILSGKTFSGEALQDLGLIDKVVPKGEAKPAVQKFIKRTKKSSRAHAAVQTSIRNCQNYRKEEFDLIIDQWVSVAMSLSERDLNKMLRLAEAQERKRTQASKENVKANGTADELNVPTI